MAGLELLWSFSLQCSIFSLHFADKPLPLYTYIWNLRLYEAIAVELQEGVGGGEEVKKWCRTIATEADGAGGNLI